MFYCSSFYRLLKWTVKGEESEKTYIYNLHLKPTIDDVEWKVCTSYYKVSIISPLLLLPISSVWEILITQHGRIACWSYSVVCSVDCGVCSVDCGVCSVQCTVISVYQGVGSEQCILFKLHYIAQLCKVCSIQCTACIMHSSVNSVQCETNEVWLPEELLDEYDQWWICYHLHTSTHLCRVEEEGYTRNPRVKSRERVYIVSVLGQEEGYTVKYNPPPEGVPEGEAWGNSWRRRGIFDSISPVES